MPIERPDSKLGSLPQNQKDQLHRWLFEETPRPSYKEVAARLHLDFSVTVSVSSICEYRNRHASEHLIAALESRIRTAREIADGVTSSPQARAAATEQTSLDLVRVALFTELSGDKPDLRSITTYAGILGASNKLELQKQQAEMDRQRLDLDQTKYRDHVAEQKRKLESALITARGGGLTPETLSKMEEALSLL